MLSSLFIDFIVCEFNVSLKPKLIKRYLKYTYLDSIFIENRVDLNCELTFMFMRNDLLYNYLNEHIDSLRFIDECLNTNKLRKAIQKYNCIKTEQSINTNWFERNIIIIIIILFIIFLIIFPKPLF